MHVCFAESSSQGLPVTTIPLWFARPLILLCCALASWEYTSQFNIQKLLTLQEICAPAGLWLQKIKVSTFVLVSCFWHQCLFSLSFWFGPLLVCYWADHGFPWNVWGGNVTEQELSRHIAGGTEQLEWVLAFLNICLTESIVCSHRYCIPDCAVGKNWEMCVCGMYGILSLNVPLKWWEMLNLGEWGRGQELNSIWNLSWIDCNVENKVVPWISKIYFLSELLSFWFISSGILSYLLRLLIVKPQKEEMQIPLSFLIFRWL